MELSKKSLARIDEHIKSLGLIADPYKPTLDSPTHDLVALHQQAGVSVHFNQMKARFGEYILALYLLGTADSHEVTDIIAFDVAGKPMGHIRKIGSKDNKDVERHVSNLLCIIKDKKWLVSVEKQIGHSLFDHGATDEVVTTLVKHMCIKVQAKSKYEATCKAFFRLMEQERAMTVDERFLCMYVNYHDITKLVLSTAYNKQLPVVGFEGAKYSVISTVMTEQECIMW